MDQAIRPPLYEYTQARIKERALEGKYNFLTQEEKVDFEKMVKDQFAKNELEAFI